MVFYIIIFLIVGIGCGLILWDCLKSKSQKSKKYDGYGEPGV